MTADQPDVKLTNRQTATATVTPEVITRLKPNEEDNTVLKFLRNILNAIIPNLKKRRTIMKKIPRIKAPPCHARALNWQRLHGFGFRGLDPGERVQGYFIDTNSPPPARHRSAIARQAGCKLSLIRANYNSENTLKQATFHCANRYTQLKNPPIVNFILR